MCTPRAPSSAEPVPLLRGRFRSTIPSGSTNERGEPSCGMNSTLRSEVVYVKRQLRFVQGGGQGTHDEWDDKLVASLQRELGGEFDIRYPRMPDEEEPRYATWKAALEDELALLDDRAVLVGHSIGGTILINTLAEQPTRRRFAAICLVAAPFVGNGGWPSDELKPARDLGARLAEDVPVHVFHGTEDESARACRPLLAGDSAGPRPSVAWPRPSAQRRLAEVAAAIRVLGS